jgi:hypothetical protein
MEEGEKCMGMMWVVQVKNHCLLSTQAFLEASSLPELVF